MASFRGHLAFSASLGVVFGGLSYWQLGYDWGTSALAAGLAAVGGMLPDLDSDSGVPVRELFGLAAVFIPLVLLRRLVQAGLESEQILVVIAILFVTIRYGAARIFKRFTVHRGMFHSVPALGIAGLATFLGYQHPRIGPRLMLTSGVMIGFLSHLVLDELYAVDFRGLKPKLNQFAGSALKFTSKSKPATAFTYVLLVLLGVMVFLDMKPRAEPEGKNPPTVSMPGPAVPTIR